MHALAWRRELVYKQLVMQMSAITRSCQEIRLNLSDGDLESGAAAGRGLVGSCVVCRGQPTSFSEYQSTQRWERDSSLQPEMAVNLYHDVVLIKFELADADHDMCLISELCRNHPQLRNGDSRGRLRKGKPGMLACDLLVWVPFTREEGPGIQTSL